MADIERSVGRLLSLGTYASIALLAVGVGLLLVGGQSPLDPSYPALDLGRLPADLAALRPIGFLWLGLLAAMVTPAARVVASLFGFLGSGEWPMAVVAVAVLAVIGASIVLGGAIQG